MSRIGRVAAKTPLFLRVAALYVVTGASIFCASQLSIADEVDASSSTPTQTSRPLKQRVVSGKPVKLVMPRLGISLPIVSGTYDSTTDTWSLSDDKAQFAAMTAQPNNARGNTFIYGHNRPAVFERTKDIRRGDTIQIFTRNHHVFTYYYVGDTIVDPTSTNILRLDPPRPRLTLMTCSGLWSEDRRLMRFEFKGVK